MVKNQLVIIFYLTMQNQYLQTRAQNSIQKVMRKHHQNLIQSLLSKTQQLSAKKNDFERSVGIIRPNYINVDYQLKGEQQQFAMNNFVYKTGSKHLQQDYNNMYNSSNQQPQFENQNQEAKPHQILKRTSKKDQQYIKNVKQAIDDSQQLVRPSLKQEPIHNQFLQLQNLIQKQISSKKIKLINKLLPTFEPKLLCAQLNTNSINLS